MTKHRKKRDGDENEEKEEEGKPMEVTVNNKSVTLDSEEALKTAEKEVDLMKFVEFPSPKEEEKEAPAADPKKRLRRIKK